MSNIVRRSGAGDEPKSSLTEEDIANDLAISMRTVQGWRHDGHGPPFMKVGGRLIRYPRDLYEAWKASITKAPK